jgi:hypothetical protein
MSRILALCLLACGCSTTLPPRAVFPLPSEVMLTYPRPLQKLPGEGEVTPQVLMETVAANYGICRSNAAGHTELINWVRRQHELK